MTTDTAKRTVEYVPPSRISQLEGRVRIAGVLLLALGLVVTEYLPRWWWESTQPGESPNQQALTVVLALGVFVLTPLGAGFLAVSLVLRGLVYPQSSRFIRWQLATGVVLTVVGICARVWGGAAANNIVEFLGPTGQAGIEITGLVLFLATQLAPTVGVALIVVLPMQIALRDRAADVLRR